MAGNSVGRSVAKVLGINVDYRHEEPLQSAGASISSVETCKYPWLGTKCLILTSCRCREGANSRGIPFTV